MKSKRPIPADVRFCATHGERKIIGHDRMETLEYERPKLRVRVTLIPKFACANAAECGVKEPVRPQGLVEGNRYDTSIAAEIITAKYGYHLPIYRQQDWFAGSGWTPSRGTLLNIAAAAGELLPPFIDYFRQEVLGSRAVGTDDTRVTLLLPSILPMPVDGDRKSQRIHDVFSDAMRDNKPSVTARMWAYRSLTVPLNVFDFTVSRHRDGADEFLVDSQFTGKLLADCYSGYQGITLPQRLANRAGRVQRARSAEDFRGPRQPSFAGRATAGPVSGVVRHRRPGAQHVGGRPVALAETGRRAGVGADARGAGR